jgi:Na+/H+ antiporter NhaD/arsenite permease-like protein
VPFTWTLRLAPQWLLVNGALLTVFAIPRLASSMPASAAVPRAAAIPPPSRPRPGPRTSGPLRLEGALNLVWLVGMIVVVFLVGCYGERYLGDGPTCAPPSRSPAHWGFAALSFKTTAPRIHEANKFSWAPIIEVAVVFVGVFVTMVPALSYLAERGASLGVTKPLAVLLGLGRALERPRQRAHLPDLRLARLGRRERPGAGALSPDNLGLLAAHPWGRSCSRPCRAAAVFMGAVTYMGNGPNFMVKAIAEQHHVRMPTFFGYTAWSFAILFRSSASSRIFF